MRKDEHFEAFSREELTELGSSRHGETRLWERIALPADMEAPLDGLEDDPSRFVLFGIPEDIGPRANLGQAGAALGWQAFLEKFLNIQANRMLPAENVLLAGQVKTADLMEEAKDLNKEHEKGARELRRLTSELDQRVTPVVRRIVEAGKCPLIVGGGHNNSYPALRGACEALREKGTIEKEEGVGCLNIDPHADLRGMEGRHSGNGFTYAYEEGYLQQYAMIGLHRNYNPGSILERFEKDPVAFHPSYFEDMLREKEQEESLEDGLSFLQERPFGLEMDLDSVAGMAVSAETPSGLHENELRLMLRGVLAKEQPLYLHFAEAAPENKPGYRTHVGKFLSYLVSDAIRWGSDPVEEGETS